MQEIRGASKGRKKAFQSKTISTLKTAVSSASSAEKNVKVLEVVEKHSQLRRLIFICAIPWDIRRWNSLCSSCARDFLPYSTDVVPSQFSARFTSFSAFCDWSAPESFVKSLKPWCCCTRSSWRGADFAYLSKFFYWYFRAASHDVNSEKLIPWYHQHGINSQHFIGATTQ